MEKFPIAESMIIEPLIEKYPHKNMPVENIYIYNKLCLDIAQANPKYEGKILEAIIERLCFLDVDVKLRKRKFEFSKA